MFATHQATSEAAGPSTAALAPASVATSRPHAAPDADPEIFRKLQLVFGTSAATAPPVPGSSQAERADAYRAFIRGQMTQDKFYENFLNLVLNIDQEDEDTAFPFDLVKKTIGHREAYFIRGGPDGCKESELVQVKPWWDLSKPIWICPESYHPEIVSDRRSGRDQFCEATHNHNSPPICRCGAYLLNCAPDRNLDSIFKKAWYEEHLRTIQYVIQSGRPFSDVLTMNETMRNQVADLFYARYHFYETGKFEYPGLDTSKPARLAPRSSIYGPTMFAGVLTSLRVRYVEPGPRNIVSAAWHEYLCTEMTSAAVEAHALWKIGTEDSNLRLKGHLGLTTTPGCQSCHARLEYGMRGLDAWLTTRHGMRILEQKPAGTTTRFYVNGSDDLRAEGPANPQWLAQTFIKQPEFATCMPKRVEKVFYADQPVPPDVHEHLVDAYRANNFSVPRLVEEAAIARYVGTPTASPNGGGGGGKAP